MVHSWTKGPVSWTPTTVKWRQFSQSNCHSTISTGQTEHHDALPPSGNVQSHLTSSFDDDGYASWHSVCRVPMVEWMLDCENCRHLTVVGLHGTGPSCTVLPTSPVSPSTVQTLVCRVTYWNHLGFHHFTVRRRSFCCLSTLHWICSVSRFGFCSACLFGWFSFAVYLRVFACVFGWFSFVIYLCLFVC